MNRAIPAILTLLFLLTLLILSPLTHAQDACTPQRVISPPEVGTDDFGASVKTNGQQWFVGAADARTLCAGTAIGCSSGAVFVYDSVDGQLVHVQTIVPPDVALYDKFGISLDVDGDRLVVGSFYSRNPDTGVRSGAVFVYEHDGERWVEVDRIWAPAGVENGFARYLHIADDALVVTPTNAVDAFVYTLDDTGEWVFSQKVAHPDASHPPAGFGNHWASMGDWLVTGAFNDRRVHFGGGAVFVFLRNASGTYELAQELFPDVQRMWMGTSVSFAGDTLVVGAPVASREIEYQGIVRLYEYDGERWVLDTELAQDQPRDGRKFGMVVRGDGDRIFVTASAEWTAISHGMVYGFERDGDGRWTQTDRFVPEGAHFAGRYGTALASNGEQVLVGAFHDETATGGLVGGAYFFDLTCNPCPADFDGDGELTIYDFLTFLNLFQDGDPLADFDGDGELTIFDFLAYQTAFDAGCE